MAMALAMSLMTLITMAFGIQMIRAQILNWVKLSILMDVRCFIFRQITLVFTKQRSVPEKTQLPCALRVLIIITYLSKEQLIQ